MTFIFDRRGRHLLSCVQGLNMAPQRQAWPGRICLWQLWDTSTAQIASASVSRSDDSWGRQLVPYLAAIIVMKLLVLLPLTLPGISTALVWFGQAILSVLSPAAQVIFVMAIFPLVMNVLQFCIVDQLIKSVDAEYERIDTEVDTLEQDYGSTSPGGLVIDRSGAPSPDTIRPLSLRPRTPSRSPSPSRSPQIHFQSRLSDDQGREARNLSPICSRPAVNVHDVLGMNQR